jgi:hypothetical protein
VSWQIGRIRALRLPDHFGRREQFAISSAVLPKLERDWKWIDVEPAPPCSLITREMKFAVMDAADRDRELVAHSTSECTRLG